MKLKQGLRPVLFDRRDFDFHKSHPFGTVVPPTFPTNYNCDSGLWNPDQNALGLPYGCTDMTQTDLCIDEDGVIHDPFQLENITHANALGGLDIRVALKACISVFKRTAYFNIQPTGGLDFFDSVRLAMLYTREEKRGVSIGTPWFPEFESPLYGVLPTPTNFDTTRASWHNWKICGWKYVGDQVYLIGKSWQGVNYADKGFHYISRGLFNSLMSIRYTAAYTISKRPANANIPVSFNLISWILTWFKTLIPNG